MGTTAVCSLHHRTYVAFSMETENMVWPSELGTLVEVIGVHVFVVGGVAVGLGFQDQIRLRA